MGRARQTSSRRRPEWSDDEPAERHQRALQRRLAAIRAQKVRRDVKRWGLRQMPPAEPDLR
jgi:hypothetical protein